MTFDDVDKLLGELLDDASRKHWDLWALWFAPRKLKLVDGFGGVAKVFDEALIESARAAKAQGIPLYQWARDYKP